MASHPLENSDMERKVPESPDRPTGSISDGGIGTRVKNDMKYDITQLIPYETYMTNLLTVT